MNIIILGIDGYIGWPLAIKLAKLGHNVYGMDSLVRRERVKMLGSNSLTDIVDVFDRNIYLNDLSKNRDKDRILYSSLENISNDFLVNWLKKISPDAIVHLAEQPSAPYSMKNVITSVHTQQQNIIGTLKLLWAIKEACLNTHLIKLGTMGEYGQPDCDIPEGIIPDNCISKWYDNICEMKGMLFPRNPGSFYHLSKVHDTYNIKFACDTWGLRSTDIMQGILYGLSDACTPYELTRFDYDEYFGTVINRFIVQALINHPLTIYGDGTQKRALLTLNDALNCITIAINNPPNFGSYRTWNQFESYYSINRLALHVKKAAKVNNLPEVKFIHMDNIRNEAQKHYYNPENRILKALGYIPTTDIQAEINKIMGQLTSCKGRVIKDVILPKTRWL